MSEFFDKHGLPLDELMQWARLFENRDYKQIARTELDGGGLLSTIWLGVDQGLGSGPPLIFETMHFPSESQWRWSTLEEAQAGHARILEERAWEGQP